MTDKSFTKWSALSDKAIAEQIGAFVRHHRLEQNITQDKLSHTAGISRSTLSLLEKGETVTLTTLIQVLRVLDQLHVLDAFTVSKSPSPLSMVRMYKELRQRARQTPKKRPHQPKS